MKKANEQRGHYGTRGKAKVSPPLPSRLSPPPFASFERLYSVRLPLDNSARGSSGIAKDFIYVFFFLHQCSATCGSGMMTRQIMCLSPGKVARPLSEEKCSAATRPQSHKVCKTQECSTLYKIDHEGDLDDHYWRLSMWTPVMFLATTCCCCRMRSNTMQCFSLKLKKQWQRKFLTMKNIRG